MTSSAGLPWSIPATERVKYDQIFEGLQPVSGLLTGDKVKPVLLNSNLPVDVLSRVWELSDIDGDGMLDREEFTVAMHLVYRALEKNPVPPAIPLEMIPPSKRRTGSSLPGAVPVLPVMPGASVLPGLVPAMSGSSAVMPGPVSVVPVIAPASGTLTPPMINAVPGGMGTKWVVGPNEKMKYDEMFRQADTDMDGYVNGAEIKDIFLQSGLPQLILAHIWNLCDTSMIGKLNSDQFALAMYLIQQKLHGIEPPAQLLPDMIPPSLRASLDGGGVAVPLAVPVDQTGMKELDVLSKGIEDLKRDKMRLEQEKAQKDADIKIRNGEVMSLQKELDALTHTVKQLELQKGEAQKRLDELDDKRTKLEASVAECKEKYQDEQKQIHDLRYQITNRESIVTNQEVELRKMKDELGSMRQRETDLEQQVDAGQRQVGQMSKKLGDMQTEIEQTSVNVKKLQEAEKLLTASIGQYDALLRNEITEEQLTQVEPVAINSGALTFKARPSVSPVLPAANAFGSPAFGAEFKAEPFGAEFKAEPFGAEFKAEPFGAEFKAEPFGAKDPFLDSAAESEPDPFGNEDPFAQVGNNGVFPSVDPFVEGSDPFGSDPFRDAFVASSDLERPSSAFGAGAAGFTPNSSSSSLKANPPGASGGDPWGASFSASTGSSFDHFDPFGSGTAANIKPQMNTVDPFGTGSFEPPSRHPASARSASQSPAAPVLPPKQKKAPAPPRPPAPKPATGTSQAGFDMVDAFDGATTMSAAPSSIAMKSEPAVGFANFSPAKFSSEAEQLAWAKRDSEQEYERLRRQREQEQADLELAIALSKQESGGTFKS